jgi:hypothetical protein
MATTWLAPASAEGPHTLYGVPTFATLQRICRKYLVEHPYTLDGDERPTCACRLRLSAYDEWLEHVSELQASHLAMAIQEARNTP